MAITSSQPPTTDDEKKEIEEALYQIFAKYFN